jgi:hypothetical protein
MAPALCVATSLVPLPCSCAMDSALHARKADITQAALTMQRVLIAVFGGAMLLGVLGGAVLGALQVWRARRAARRTGGAVPPLPFSGIRVVGRPSTPDVYSSAEPYHISKPSDPRPLLAGPSGSLCPSMDTLHDDAEPEPKTAPPHPIPDDIEPPKAVHAVGGLVEEDKEKLPGIVYHVV